MSDHYILTNAIVSDGYSFLRENAALEIKAKKILKIGNANEFLNSEAETIDLEGRLVLPGLLNPHHHLYSALATGLAPVGPTEKFSQLLENLWWRLDRSLDATSIYYSAISGLMQSARYGVTTVIDHHASMRAVPGSLNIIKKAFEAVGLKGLLCYEVSDRMGSSALKEQIDENIDFWSENTDSEHVHGLFGMHANFTLSERSMKMIREAKPESLPVHIHCGEDISDLNFCIEQGYAGPVDRLAKFGLLSADSLLAHCIHLSEKDFDLLKDLRPVVVSNPESNANNNVGVMQIGKIPRYVLGTDGMTGNITGTMRSHFLRRNANVPAPEDVLFRYPAEIIQRYFPGRGILRSGGYADLAITNYQPVTPISLKNLFYHLVFGVQGKEMYMTISEGKIIFSNNKIRSLDEKKMNAEIRKAVKKLYDNYAI
ncbi:MAG: amidohydrolase family protein [Candidatus Marinimicrobia bacterium]|nr:amidohydrolase family protein [Candidatus Neomarinimicrobiota bacterium]